MHSGIITTLHQHTAVLLTQSHHSHERKLVRISSSQHPKSELYLLLTVLEQADNDAMTHQRVNLNRISLDVYKAIKVEPKSLTKNILQVLKFHSTTFCA